MNSEDDILDPLGIVEKAIKTRNYASKVVEAIINLADNIEKIRNEISYLREDVESIKNVVEELGGVGSGKRRKRTTRSNVRKSDEES